MLFTNKVAAAMPKIKIYYNHKNHTFSKLILKCESCVVCLWIPGPQNIMIIFPNVSYA